MLENGIPVTGGDNGTALGGSFVENLPKPDDYKPLSDTKLLDLYKDVGVTGKYLRCPNCLKRTPLRHRQLWKECLTACPACHPDEQHHGQV